MSACTSLPFAQLLPGASPCRGRSANDRQTMICRPAAAAAAAAALYLVFGRCFRLPVGCWMKLFAQSLAGPSVGQGKRGGCWGTRTKDTVVDKIWECCHVKMVGIGLAVARKIAPAFAVVSSKRRRRCRCLTRLDFDICFSSL